jgi:hypothetical protein
MKTLLLTVSLLAATPSPPPPQVSPQFLVGEWRSEQDGVYYHFHANGTCFRGAADIWQDVRWKLRDGHTLELGEGKQREIIVIDRVVHETLFVRTRYQREVWLKQPGP